MNNINKIILTSVLLTLQMTGQGQTIIDNLRMLLPGETRFKPQADSCIDLLVFKDGASFVGINLQLLPGHLEKNYAENVSFQAMGNEEPKQFKFIVRVMQEDSFTKRLDFYSRELIWDADTIAAVENWHKLESEIRYSLTQHSWKEKEAGSGLMLLFQYADLEMTVMMESISDVEVFPFWHNLHNNFHFHRPANHLSSLKYYLHFVVRERSGTAAVD